MSDPRPPESLPDDQRPLTGLVVLDFSQFLAGPSAALRLADLGARVIKIERPGTGEIGRHLYISDLEFDGDSTLFHSINRNKQSYAADLKNPVDIARVRRLIAQADVLIQNFRPGVIERLGLGYESVREINPRLVYGTVTGYGNSGPVARQTGSGSAGSVAVGSDLVERRCDAGTGAVRAVGGGHVRRRPFAQGILACLVRRGITGKGGLVEVSLLESVLDLAVRGHHHAPERWRATTQTQSAQLRACLPGGAVRDLRNGRRLSGDCDDAGAAPGRIDRLRGVSANTDPGRWFGDRDEIKALLADHLARQTTEHWLALLEPADVWCADV